MNIINMFHIGSIWYPTYWIDFFAAIKHVDGISSDLPTSEGLAKGAATRALCRLQRIRRGAWVSEDLDILMFFSWLMIYMWIMWCLCSMIHHSNHPYWVEVTMADDILIIWWSFHDFFHPFLIGIAMEIVSWQSQALDALEDFNRSPEETKRAAQAPMSLRVSGEKGPERHEVYEIG